MLRYKEVKTGKIFTPTELRDYLDKEAEEKSHDEIEFQAFLKRTCDPIDILSSIYRVDKDVYEKMRKYYKELFKEDIISRTIERKINRHILEYR